ncbi:MAG: SPOR domain-containing protein [Pseudomonadota bacterium]
MQDAYYDDSNSQAGVRSVLLTTLRWGSAALSIALIAVIVLWAYRLGVRDVREIPVVRALDTPARTQPDAPGGAQAAHQGLEVNEVLAGTPNTQAAAPVAPEPEPVLTPEDVSPSEAEGEGAQTAQPTPDGASNPNDPLAAAIDAAIAQVGAEDDGAPSAAPTPLARSARPEQRPQGASTLDAPAQTDATNAAEAREVAAIGTPAPATTTGAGRRYQVFPGAQLVQLGAFESEQDAIAEWNRLVDGNEDLLTDRRRYVEAVNSGNRGFYRLRAVGFSTGEEAGALCTALKARGVDCIPVVQR